MSDGSDDVGKDGGYLPQLHKVIDWMESLESYNRTAFDKYVLQKRLMAVLMEANFFDDQFYAMAATLQDIGRHHPSFRLDYLRPKNPDVRSFDPIEQ